MFFLANRKVLARNATTEGKTYGVLKDTDWELYAILPELDEKQKFCKQIMFGPCRMFKFRKKRWRAFLYLKDYNFSGRKVRVI